jgi:hypothetical protein
MTKMSCLDLVRHWQGFVEQKHGYSHGRIVFFGGLPRWVSTFVRNVFLVEEWERSDLYICHTIFVVCNCYDVIENEVVECNM